MLNERIFSPPDINYLTNLMSPLFSLNFDVLRAIADFLSPSDAWSFASTSRAAYNVALPRALSSLTCRGSTDVEQAFYTLYLGREDRLRWLRSLSVSQWRHEDDAMVENCVESTLALANILSGARNLVRLHFDDLEGFIAYQPPMLDVLAGLRRLSDVKLSAVGPLTLGFLARAQSDINALSLSIMPLGALIRSERHSASLLSALSRFPRLSKLTLDEIVLSDLHTDVELLAVQSLSIDTVCGSSEFLVPLVPNVETLEVKTVHNAAEPTSERWEKLRCFTGEDRTITCLLPLLASPVKHIHIAKCPSCTPWCQTDNEDLHRRDVAPEATSEPAPSLSKESVEPERTPDDIASLSTCLAQSHVDTLALDSSKPFNRWPGILLSSAAGPLSRYVAFFMTGVRTLRSLIQTFIV